MLIVSIEFPMIVVGESVKDKYLYLYTTSMTLIQWFISYFTQHYFHLPNDNIIFTDCINLIRKVPYSFKFLTNQDHLWQNMLGSIMLTFLGKL